MSHLEYVKYLWTKVQRCGTVYSEDRLKGIFIEGLNSPIRQIIRGYCNKKAEADLQDLARQDK